MKRLLRCALLALLCLCTYCSFSQAFDKNTILISGGFGISSDFIPLNGQDGLNSHTRVGLSTPLPQFNFKTELAVHRYWSVGLLTSVSGGRVYDYSVPAHLLNIDAGLFTNFHFYQMIADKTGWIKKMHSDKLDIYTGGGFSLRYRLSDLSGYPARRGLYDIVPDYHIGVRYQATPRVGFFGEIGLGQSLFNAGIVFKIGMPRKAKPIKAF